MFQTLRVLFAALFTAGAIGIACSSHTRDEDTATTRPLGQSTAELPANPSMPPADAAVTEPPPVEKVPPISRPTPTPTPAPQTQQPVPAQQNPAQPNPTPPLDPGLPPPTTPGPNPPAPSPLPPAPSPMPAPSTPPSTTPLQLRSDGGVPPIAPPRDAGVPGGRRDAGVAPGPARDAGVAPRRDGGVTVPRGDGGLR